MSLAVADDLWELIALWYLGRIREVIAQDLIRDYHGANEILTAARGQIDAVATSDRYYSGSLSFSCTFDDFTSDNAFNRVLLAALNMLLQSNAVSLSLRSECRRFTEYFQAVGVLQPDDLNITLDRRTAYYSDAFSLARLIISASASSLKEGDLKAWTFLIRTPETVEAGVRAILKEGLEPSVHVLKYGTALKPAKMSINPDLRFDPMPAIGDIKYKLFGEEWPRGDLYQSVAFAAGSGSDHACVVSFDSQRPALPTVQFRNIAVSSLTWDIGVETTPAEASEKLVSDCRQWLENRAVLAFP